MRAGGTDQGRHIDKPSQALEVSESEQAREQACKRVVLDASVHVDRIQHHMWLLWRGLLAEHACTALRLRQGLNSQTEHELLVKILSESVQEVGVGAERLVFVRKLPKDQHVAVTVVGHVRSSSGALQDLHGDTKRLHGDAGNYLYAECILKTALASAPMRGNRQMSCRIV